MLLHAATTVTELLRSFFVAERTAKRDGLLQSLQPHTTVLGVAVLLLGVVLSRDPIVLLALAVAPIALALASSVSLRRLAARTALPALASLLVILPQAVLLPGASLVDVGGLTVTAAGAVYVLAFTLRVWIGVALLALLVLTTPFSAIVAGLRRLGLPVILVRLLAVTYRYLFLFFSELQRLLRARESRTVGTRTLRDAWRDVGRLAGTFLIRTIERGERTHRGMVARGGGREPSPYPPRGELGATDWLFLATTALVTVVAGVIRWPP